MTDALRTWVAEHRCVTGGWRRGKTKDCYLCRAGTAGKGKPAKRIGES